MDYSGYLQFLGNDFLFSITIVLVSFVLGWVLYSNVVLRKINLRDALFEKDNLAAWVEFIGAFIFPTLFLAAKAIEGSADSNIFIDLLVCAVYAIAYIVIFTILRLLSGAVIKQIAPPDKEGKVTLNSEIYTQKNVAASLFSVTFSIMFVSFVRFLDFTPEYILGSLLKISAVIIFTLLTFVVYSMILRKKTTLFKEIFIDNNPAAGVALAGFMFAVEMIISNMVLLQKEFDYAELLIFSAIGLVIFGVLSVVFKWLFTKMIKVDIWKEVYEQNNIGAAIGQVALYVGIANVIIHFMK